MLPSEAVAPREHDVVGARSSGWNGARMSAVRREPGGANRGHRPAISTPSLCANPAASEHAPNRMGRVAVHRARSPRRPRPRRRANRLLPRNCAPHQHLPRSRAHDPRGAPARTLDRLARISVNRLRGGVESAAGVGASWTKLERLRRHQPSSRRSSFPRATCTSRRRPRVTPSAGRGDAAPLPQKPESSSWAMTWLPTTSSSTAAAPATVCLPSPPAEQSARDQAEVMEVALELVHRVHLLKGQWEKQSADDVRQPDYRPVARAAGDAVE